ncbi:MAG: hypothetical protein ACOC80_09345 [Petrotogales bacterium]
MWKLPDELPITNHKRADRYQITNKDIKEILREVEENGNSEKFEKSASKESKERN